MISLQPPAPDDPRRIGRYAVLGRLGEGGMGLVYLARSPGGAQVALKVVHEAYAASEVFRARFRREAAAAASVSGAFTAPVLDADPDAPRPWLATAYLVGPTLQEAVDRHGPWGAAATAGLGAALAEALVSIHRAGVVHRDLKPSNVMLTADGPRVIDFGIARAADADAITRHGTVLGTPGYLAPEQALGGVTGTAGDVFALGGVLAFTATGTGPFGRAELAEMLHRVVHEPPRIEGIADERLRSVVAACLAKDPAARPTTAGLLGMLGAPLPALPSDVAADIAGRERPRRFGRRGVLVAAGAAAGVVGAGALGAFGVAALLRDDGEPDPVDTGPPLPKRPGRAGVAVWTRDLAAAVRASPAVAGGIALFGDDGGTLSALDLRTGTVRWRYRAGAAITGPVAVAGGLAVLAAGGALHAVRPGDGRRAWHRDLDEAVTGLTVAGAVLYAAGEEGTVHCLALDGGAVRWRRATGREPAGAPAVAGGTVVVAAGGLLGLSARDGRTRWTAGGGASPVAVAGGLLLSGTGAPALEARDARTRKVAFTVETDDEVRAPATASGGFLYFADSSGALYALDAKGARRWRAQPGGAVDGGITASGGRLYVGTGDHLVYGVDAANGTTLWSYETSDALGPATPAVAGDSLLVGGLDGRAHALRTHPERT
ncbi:outer membrane protein assembly factor BamB family protein [Actinomadura parmotrematis]|uniref:PQQ-binding-like beta-propeller repeat protein n=1 Tax=Actinomadura parmotrematis TaxID=2864039 RepID=A0ABS7G2A6_9ACTN|nr:serine/threonine-protein kinase [Actinomadura parmotrematis]MBW8486844.1 PQQ-binding-like beta-propeller repeat protein [Actinomadura parmotrematis]